MKFWKLHLTIQGVPPLDKRNLRFLSLSKLSSKIKLFKTFNSIKSIRNERVLNIFENNSLCKLLFIEIRTSNVYRNLLTIAHVVQMICNRVNGIDNKKWNAFARIERDIQWSCVLEIHRNSRVLWLNWNEWKELRNGRDFCVGIYVHIYIYIQRNGVEIVETIRGISTRRRIEMTSTASVSFTFHGLVILEAFIECKPVGRAMCTCVSAFLHAIYIYIYIRS